MKNKNYILIIIVAIVLIFSLSACAKKTEDTTSNDVKESPAPSIENMPEPTITNSPTMESEPNSEMKVFTLAELSTYNGSNGMPAYVAVDGVVYDLTNSNAWKNGKHNGFTAGRDLSDEIKEISPHGVKNLEGIPVVGKLAEE